MRPCGLSTVPPVCPPLCLRPHPRARPGARALPPSGARPDAGTYAAPGVGADSSPVRSTVSGVSSSVGPSRPTSALVPAGPGRLRGIAPDAPPGGASESGPVLDPRVPLEGPGGAQARRARQGLQGPRAGRWTPLLALPGPSGPHQDRAGQDVTLWPATIHLQAREKNACRRYGAAHSTFSALSGAAHRFPWYEPLRVRGLARLHRRRFFWRVRFELWTSIEGH